MTSGQLNNLETIIDQAHRTEIENLIKEKFVLCNVCELLQAIDSELIMRRHWAVIGIRKMFTTNTIRNFQPNQKEHISAILLQNIRQTEYPQLQLQSLRILAINVQDDQYICSQVVKRQGISLLLSLLQSKHKNIALLALQNLTSIAYTRTWFKDIIKMQGIHILVNFIEHQILDELISKAADLLLILCKMNPPPSEPVIEALVKDFLRFINQGKFKYCLSLAEILGFITNYHKDRQHFEIPNLDASIQKYFELLYEKSQKIINGSLDMLCWIAKRNVNKISCLLLEEHLRRIVQLLDNYTSDQTHSLAYQLLHLLIDGSYGQGRTILNNQRLLKSATFCLGKNLSLPVIQAISLLAKLTEIQPSSDYFEFLLAQKVLWNIAKAIHMANKINPYQLKPIIQHFYKLVVSCLRANENETNAVFNEEKVIDVIENLKANNNQLISDYAYLILSII